MNLNKAYQDLPIIRNEDVFYLNFKNNGSSNLNIDGTTPKIFTLEGLPAQDIIVTRVDFLIGTDAAIDTAKFGSLSALVNGIDFTFNGTVNFKTNSDMLLFASDASIYTAKISGVASGIINGHWNLKNSFFGGLIANTSNFSITIKDNLSGITAFKVSVSGIKLK